MLFSTAKSFVMTRRNFDIGILHDQLLHQMDQLAPVLFLDDGCLQWGLTEDVESDPMLVVVMSGEDVDVAQANAIFRQRELLMRQRSLATVAQDYEPPLGGPDDVVSAKAGDVVEVIDLAPEVLDETEGTGWCRVRCSDNTVGLFPLLLLDFYENF